MAEQAPADVQAKMRPGGVSLRFGQAPIGLDRQQVLLHVYVVPKSLTTAGGVPLHRADIQSGTSLPMSQFYLDLLIREKGLLRRLNTVSFEEDGDVNASRVRWLEPKTRRGPVLLLRFGVGDIGEWHLFAFPKGVERAAVQKVFAFSGDQDSMNTLHFDAVDAHGKMTVLEEWSEGDKEGVNRYPWNGVEFEDRTKPYFIIAASVKTRVGAKTFVQHHKGLEDSEIRSSNHYPGLLPGYFIVIATRFEKQADAQIYAKEARKEGTACYVRRAF